MAPEPKLWSDATPPHDYEPDSAAVIAAKSLTELADVFGSDKGSVGNAHDYARIYERLIPRDIGGLCEIGVACGASLKMWSRYLPAARVVGIDVREGCGRLCKQYKNVDIRIGDACKMEFANHFDVVIDDASHIAEDIVAFFNHCWRWVKPGGLYIVEDLACTYDDAYAKEYNAGFAQTKPNDRRKILDMLDGVMRSIDARAEITALEYHPQLLVIRKSADWRAGSPDNLVMKLFKGFRK